MTDRPTALLASAFLVALTGCATDDPIGDGTPFEVRSFGEMRRVLRMGDVEGKVGLVELVDELSAGDSTGVVGVGAMAGLAGEVTINDGRILVSEVVSADESIRTREADSDDRAAMLVAARVDAWEAVSVGPTRSYAALEDRIAAELSSRGFDLSVPTPIRLSVTVRSVRAHVIDGACPIADPDGSPPGRFQCEDERVDLVGFYVEGAAGVFTHHDRRSHLHAVSTGGSGHLEAIDLEGGSLHLPTARAH